MLGDFNSRVGVKTGDTVIGPYGEVTTNGNGERLIDLCETNELKVTNGFFQHKDIHKYTWEQHTRQLKSIIDYCIVKQDTKLKIHDVRVQRGANCGSDHYFLRIKLHIPKWQEKLKKTSVINNNEIEDAVYPRYNIRSLNQESTKVLYQQRLNQYLNEPNLTSFNETYKNVIESIHKAAFEALGNEERKTSKKLWWTKEIEDLVKLKKQKYFKWLGTKRLEDREEYNDIRKVVRRTVNHEKNEYWDRRCREVDTYIGGRQCSEAWKFVKALKNTSGRDNAKLQIINEDQWVGHYQKLLSEDRPQFMEQDNPVQVEGEQVQVSIEDITKAIQNLKNGKSCGPEGVYAELLKSGTPKLFNLITLIFNKCLNGQEVPKEWKEAHIVSIHKKGEKNNCENYRGISITSTMSRLYGRILRDIIERECEDDEEQCGFRAGRSCNDNIFCMKQIIEKRAATNQETHVLFVDLTKAYDNIPICKLWETLSNTNLNHTLILALKNLYANSISKIKNGKKLSPPFKVTKGLRQGCCISPTLFKIYVKQALLKWKQKCHGMGVPLNNDTVYTLQFADDQAVLAGDKEDLEYMSRKLKETYNEWGLSMNVEKTKYLCIGGNQEDLQINDHETIGRCKEYKYLGVIFDSSGTDEKEIRSRVIQARRAIGCLNSILWDKHISRNRKFSIYNTMIKTTLIHGAETWRLTERNKKKVEATEMDAIRRSAGISRLQHKRNEEVLRLMGLQDTIHKDIERKQLIWYGHVQRMDDTRLPKKVMQWIPVQKKKRGRPKKNWSEGIRRAMSARDLQDGQWENRKRWNMEIGQRRRTF